MDLSKIWLIIESDGDIDYTNVYLAEGATTHLEAEKLLDDIAGHIEDDGDYHYRVASLRSLAEFKERIAEDEED